MDALSPPNDTCGFRTNVAKNVGDSADSELSSESDSASTRGAFSKPRVASVDSVIVQAAANNSFLGCIVEIPYNNKVADRTAPSGYSTANVSFCTISLRRTMTGVGRESPQAVSSRYRPVSAGGEGLFSGVQPRTLLFRSAQAAESRRSRPKGRNKTRDRRNAALGVANERRFFLEERHPASDSENASEFRTVT
jgi:hypothetical protein